ncbi:MAG: NADH-quinone oxidoreductase subunit L [Parachlamydia sp.]|nr:NADH-quinone oxidoreductase subunit L [Parachlamydia sp.]
MHLLVLTPLLLPLLGFIALLLLQERLGRKGTGWLACGTVALSFLFFAILTLHYLQQGMAPYSLPLYQWLAVSDWTVEFTLRIDSLSLLMALIVTGVGFLIHVYSIGYMDHERDYSRYFACLNFFIFAMLLLVLAGDLVLLFFGWEGVGLASYLLIGFWYARPAAAQAAKKAFVVNRIGDLGFLLGLLLALSLFKTTQISSIETSLPGASLGLTVMALLFFWGATGKSAQLPLYNWLPDAMEGPTPVSALIHAATMVTAGVYLVVRLHEVYSLSPFALQVVGIVGGATALFASGCALAQKDLKRVLAYSTVSQLGLMFLACGIEAYYAALFHLTTHAFIKALLFLSTGNVVHMMHGNTLLEKMGGLASIFTKTHWLFLIGALALAGVPPFAAFFSKDLILEIEYLEGMKGLYLIALAASVLTAVYMMRAYCLAFIGPKRSSPEELKGVREAPPIMLLPLYVLALLAVLGGFLGFAFNGLPPLEFFLKEVDILPLERELSTGLHLSFRLWVAIGGALLGVIFTAFIYARFSNRLSGPPAFLRKSFYVETLYHHLIVRPLAFVADEIVEFFEPTLFEGSIDQAGKAAQGTAGLLQRLQSGQIRSYIAWMAIGAAFLVIYFIIGGLNA